MWCLWPSLSLKEVTDESQHNKYFIFTNRALENDEHLKLSLINGKDSYQAKITLEDIKDMAETSRMPLPEFLQLTISALTWNSVTSCTFAYAVCKKDASSLELTWKKVVPEDSIKIKLGSLKLAEVDNSAEVCTCLQVLSRHMLDVHRQLEKISDTSREAEEKMRSMEHSMESDILSMEKLQLDMFSKFVLVLNKKKEKCRQYKEQIAKLKDGQASSSSRVGGRELAEKQEPARSKTCKDSTLLFEDSDDDDGITSTQTQRIVKNRKNKKMNFVPGKELPRRKTKNQVSGSFSTLTTDTQELMEDL